VDRDLGLAAERTALAWQRTSLAVMAGGAVLCRLTLEDHGPRAVVPLLLGVALAGWALLEARVRLPRRTVRGGRAAAVLSAAVVLLAVAQLGIMLSRS
jgi:uncharacterized membrane protein YidH (DUF202 family)